MEVVETEEGEIPMAVVLPRCSMEQKSLIQLEPSKTPSGKPLGTMGAEHMLCKPENGSTDEDADEIRDEGVVNETQVGSTPTIMEQKKKRQKNLLVEEMVRGVDRMAAVSVVMHMVVDSLGHWHF